MPTTNPALYHEARSQIRDGDLLLFRRRCLISIAGRGEHSHAGKAAWLKCNRLLLLEMLQFKGGRGACLSGQVREHPGRWDVFEANPENRWPEYSRDGATRYMASLAGTAYGYLGIAHAALLHLPLVRCFVHPDTDDERCFCRPAFCSQACALADRAGGGVDPVPQLADRLTEPCDLARSPFYRYRFTLYWDKEQLP